jgi:hypothetical protein
MKVKKAFVWHRNFSSIETVDVPAGAPVHWHEENKCHYVTASFFHVPGTQGVSITEHDAIYYGCRVAPDNVDHEGQALSKDDYATATAVQCACNLGAMIHLFDRIIDKLQYEARIFGHGTDWINQHPITRMFAEQIAFLSSPRDYSEAANICETKAKE